MKATEIKIALLKLGIKQVEIARRLNVSRQAVNSVINGRLRSNNIESYIERLIRKQAA